MLTKIFAHRGASQYAPENTMAAFKLAYTLGADGIETDVHLTKDQIPVLIHDEHLKRTTNGNGLIKDYTFAELKQLDAGSWFSSEYSGETIITLDHFLQWVKSKKLHINIELKNNKIDYRHIEPLVYEMITHYQLLDYTVISTFNAESAAYLSSFTNIETALLTSKRNKKLVNLAKDIGVNALHIKYRLLNLKLMEQAKQHHMAVRVYTVNKQAHMLHCFSHQCDGIFTDIPDTALTQRKIYTIK